MINEVAISTINFYERNMGVC